MRYRSNVTYLEGKKFDSNFEACVYYHLLDHFPESEYRIDQQYRIPLCPSNSYVKPNRSFVWRCDFAVIKKGETVPSLFVEAKGQVDRGFPLTLALLEPWVIEKLIIVCSDEKATTKLNRLSGQYPIIKELDDLIDFSVLIK